MNVNIQLISAFLIISIPYWFIVNSTIDYKRDNLYHIFNLYTVHKSHNTLIFKSLPNILVTFFIHIFIISFIIFLFKFSTKHKTIKEVQVL
jgi:hypothetical protein